MFKKFLTLFAVLAFTSSASVALACDKGKKDKHDDSGDSALTSVSADSCGGGSCSRDKDKDSGQP